MAAGVALYCCPIGARSDVADVDAALRRVGEDGAESLSAIARRLELAKATLSRHRSGCLGLGSAPAVPPPGPGGAPGTAVLAVEREPTSTPERPDKAIHARGKDAPRETALERPGTTRSPFAGLVNPGDDAMTSPRRLVAADVERRCLDLRIQGKSYAEISDIVGVTEDTAMDAVERVLRRTRGKTDSRADIARALEVRRCDAIVESFWARATDPNRALGAGDEDGAGGCYDPSQDKAAIVLLKAMERRAKLLGLDVPTSGPLVNVNVIQLPSVQNLLRAVLGALERHPVARVEVLAAVRAAQLGPGTAPAALPAPQVIEMLPEPAAGGSDG